MIYHCKSSGDPHHGNYYTEKQNDQAGNKDWYGQQSDKEYWPSMPPGHFPAGFKGIHDIHFLIHYRYGTNARRQAKMNSGTISIIIPANNYTHQKISQYCIPVIRSNTENISLILIFSFLQPWVNPSDTHIYRGLTGKLRKSLRKPIMGIKYHWKLLSPHLKNR